MPEKTGSSTNTASRRSRGRRRLPYLPIVLLVLVAFVVLAFVTFRQLRSAQEHRLRLLAGFGDRVELTIPQLAGRFARIIQEHDHLERIRDYVGIVPHLQFVGDPQKLTDDVESTAQEKARAICEGRTDGLRRLVDASLPCLVLQSQNDQIELIYVGVPGQPATPPEPSTDAEGNPLPTGTGEGDAPEDGESSANTLLSPPPGQPLEGLHVFFGRIALRPLLREILIADVFDSVLVASSRTGRVLHQEGEPALVVADLSSLLARAEPSFDLARDGPATALVDVTLSPASRGWLKEGGYKLFLQPISLDPDLPGMNVASEDWLAAGLISDENLLASGFSTSPLLLFVLVVSFPSALIAWPFLKLWLISPRQSMTRFDIAALVASSLLGLTLVTLLIFDLLLLSRLHGRVDDELFDMSASLEQNYVNEVGAMRLQLDDLTDAREEWDHNLTFDSFDEVRDLIALQTVRFEHYPYFHSVFWADEDGVQVRKLPLREYAIFPSKVSAREYFQCARNQRLSPDWRQDSEETCLEAIFSNTTGRDLVALARWQGDEVAVMTTNLISFRQAVLPPGFGFAVVDTSGRAVFHSDERRNMTEDFLKASDENRLLSALLAARRPGHLTVNYWGDRSRLYLNPIEGRPWTLITYRSSTDLRLRNFEVIYDFLTGMIPYLLIVLATLLLITAIRRRSSIRWLWPAAENTGLYRLLILIVAILTGGVSLAIAFASPGVLFWWTIAVPLLTMLIAAVGYQFRKGLKKKVFEDVATSRPLAVWLEAAAFGFLIVTTGAAFYSQRGFILGFLLAAGLVGAAAWLWARSYFVAEQRRISATAALAALLFATSVLPTVGFFQLASTRQLQSLTQDTQAGLARALEMRESGLDKTRSTLTQTRSNLFVDYDLRAETVGLLSAFFDTKEVDEAAWALAKSDDGPLWPLKHDQGLPPYLTLLSGRPVPLSEIAAGREGLDLSRFGPPPHEWRRGNGDRSVIGRFTEPWGTGQPVYLESTLFSRTAKTIPVLRGVIVVVALLLLVALPALVARFLADRVLLARLARTGDATPSLGELVQNWSTHVELRRVLLVTSLPELAILQATKSKAFRVVPFEAPTTDAEDAGNRADDGPKNEKAKTVKNTTKKTAKREKKV